MSDGESLAVQERKRLSSGGLLGPDRDNLAVILTMSAFVRDSLGREPADVIEHRLTSFRTATDAAVRLGALPELVRPVFDDLIQRVQAATAGQPVDAAASFSAAISSMIQAADDLAAPSPTMLDAGVAAGADSPSTAARIWRAMSALVAR